MSIVEEKIWNYIDGTCKDDERNTISNLIEQNELYREKYLELMKLNDEFAGIELEEPSMAFNYNVMETIRTEQAQKPLSVKVNLGIIKAIGAFFVFTIVAFLVFILTNTNFSGTGALPLITNFKMPDMSIYFTGPVIKGFLFCDVILGLFFVDYYRRKNGLSKQS